jgi:hypothetical protein
MAWTTPRTWVTGELVPASTMNTHVRDNVQYLYDNSPRRVYTAPPVSFSNNTAENTLFQYTVPAGRMGTSLSLRFYGFLNVVTDAARNVNTRLKFGGVTQIGSNIGFAAASTNYTWFMVHIQNTAAAAQKITARWMSAHTAGGASWTAIGTSPGQGIVGGATAATVDTTVDAIVALTMQMDAAAAAYSVNLNSGFLELV